MTSTFRGPLSRRLLWSLFGLLFAAAFTSAPAQNSQTPVVILEDINIVTADPSVFQNTGSIRPTEALIPPPPLPTAVSTTTETASLLVQRSDLGIGWYELNIETEVLNGLLEFHGLASDQRSRMLRWERDEVRAGCYRRLVAILNKTSRTPAEQRVCDAMVNLIKSAHIAATEESQRLDNKWFAAPHLSVPPPPFTYDRPPPGNYGLFYLAGGPKPPSFSEFQQYGVAKIFAGAGDGGVMERLIASTALRSNIISGAVLSSGVVGATAGVALAATLPTAVANIIVRTLAPFAVRATFSSAAAGLSIAGVGLSVFGAVVSVIVTSVFEGIAVVEAEAIPGQLQVAVNNARNMTVNLSDYLTNEANLSKLYVVFLRTTLPDFAATEQAPIALATDQQWLTAPAGTGWYRPVPALQMLDRDGKPISVRLVDGWFVVRDSEGREVMTVNLAFQGPEGQYQTITKLASGFFCTDTTGNPAGCSKVSEFPYRNWNKQARTAKLGAAGAQAVINPLTITDGQVATPYSQTLTVASPGAGAYTFSLVSDTSVLPPGLSISSAGVITGSPTIPGEYSFEVFATNPGGTHPVIQRFSMRISGTPVSAPPNLVSAWLLEDSALDSIGTSHGTWTGTPAYAPGWVGKAASFTGTNYIELPQNIFPSGARSFETWFRTTSPGIILGQVGTNTGYVPAIYVDTGGKLRVQFFWGGISSPVTTAATVTNGQWHHVAVTFNNSFQQLYLDGVPAGTMSFTHTEYAAGYRYFLGSGTNTGWPAAGAANFNGLIDEPALYNRALTQAEVSAIYNAGGAGKLNLTLGTLSSSATTGVYRSEALSVTRNGTAAGALSSLRTISGVLPHGMTLNAAASSLSGTPRSAGTYSFRLRATDATGHSGERSYTITVTGPWRPRPDGIVDWWSGEGSTDDRIPSLRSLVWYNAPAYLSYTPGLTGQAFANQSYAFVPTFPNFGITGITFETWFQTTHECVILGKTINGIGTPILWVGRDGFVRGDFSPPASGAQSNPITGNFRVDDGGWHHVAISYGSGEQRIHVDGILAGVGRGLTNSGQVFGNNFTLGGCEIMFTAWPGLPQGTGSYLYLATPVLDEPAVYGRVLETAEVNGVFASGSRGKPALTVAQSSLPAVYYGIPYRQPLTATGATGAVTWSITGGALPDGLRLTSAGVISGMLSRIRSTFVTIQATDSTGAVAVRDYYVTALGAATPLPSNAVAWWRGEMNTQDSIGTRHGGILSGGPSYRTGSAGSAFYFTRPGSSMTLPSGSFPPMNTITGSNIPYTFETWFMTDRPGVILGRRDFAYAALPVVYKPCIYIGTDGLLHAPMFEVDRTGTAPVSSQRVDDSRFHHLAVTYDGGILRLFVDGILQSPVITSATSRFGSLVDTIEIGTGFTGTIGLTWPATPGGWLPFTGVIDEPTTYNRALLAPEIQLINAAGESGKAVMPVQPRGLPAGTVDASYLTDAYDGSDAVVYLSAGELPPGLRLGTDGIISGIPTSAGNYIFLCGIRRADGTWISIQYQLNVAGVPASPVGLANWYSGENNLSGHLGESATAPAGISYGPGRVGQSFALDGVSQFLSVTGIPFPAPSGEWSFETWFRSTSPGIILGQTGTGGYIPVLYINSEGRLNAEPYNSGLTETQMQSTARVDDGYFHHVVITYSNGLRSLYLDGALLATRTAVGIPYSLTYNWQIGNGVSAGWPLAPANTYFSGQIDEPQFYNRALTDAEARRGFRAGKLGRSALVMDNTLTDTPAGTGSYSRQITTTGGTAPYTYALAEGRIPEGLTLSPQGLISGPLTYSSGTFDFAVTATAANGAKSIRDYRIVVRPNFRYRPAGLKAWWGANGNATDWQGAFNGSDFSNVSGQPFTYGSGIHQQAFAFRGLGVGQVFGIPVINEAVNLPQAAFPALGERGPFSLELWFRATQPGGILGQSYMIVLGTYTLPMLYIDTTGRLRTQLGGSGAQNQLVSPGVVLDNTWHHFVGTLDAAGLMKVYLDGTLTGTLTGVGPVRENPDVQFYLGHVLAPGWPASGDTSTGVTFTGWIDEVATYTRVLTLDEIQRLSSCGPNGKTDFTVSPAGTLPSLVRNTAWTRPLTVTSQATPYFTVASGSLPPGISCTTPVSVNPPVFGLYGTPTTVGSWDFILRNSRTGATVEDSDLVDEQFNLTVDFSSAYKDWADSEPTGPASSSRLPLAQPFADDTNLLKFAFNLRPGASDLRTLVRSTGTAGLPSITRDPAGRLVIEFIRRRAATNPGITYQVETGPAPGPFTPLSLAPATITQIDSTWERVIVTDPAITPRRFGRVTILQN